MLNEGSYVSFSVHMIEIDTGDLGAGHAGLDERVDDRPVTSGPVAFALRVFI
jgi:hypothetical protein